jgi:hypothetical protein
LKSFSTATDVEYQLVPPHCHIRNAAEGAIHTFKENCVAGLAPVDPDFPLHLLDRLLPQAEMTLNLLRKSRKHPQLSAASHYHGMVDYNKTAFAPPGCKIIAHENPPQRRTWAPHGQHGYSLGPVIHHYRCQNIETLEFPPHNSPIPQLSSTDRLLMAVNDMANTLKHPYPEVPFAQVGYDTIIASTRLAAIFKKNVSKTNSARTYSSPSQGRRKKTTSSIGTTIFNFSHAEEVYNKVKNTNHCEHSTQHAVTSEGGHTNDGPVSISEGASANAKSFPHKFVTRRFLEHGNRQPGNYIGRQSLVTAIF